MFVYATSHFSNPLFRLCAATTAATRYFLYHHIPRKGKMNWHCQSVVEKKVSTKSILFFITYVFSDGIFNKIMRLA